MEPTAGRADRTLLIVISAIVALVALALAAVLLRGEPELLDAATPEGVVQRYAAAVIEGDERTAALYLTDRAQENCEFYRNGSDESLRVSLVSTKIFDGTADVVVSITTSYGDAPFGASEYRTEETFDLLQENGEWKIDGAPWQLSTVCQEVTP